ncbi:MAG TPA: hypothetical protein PLO33_01030 [Kouleothrix sp.]|uniref:hypothetical protein n=1 Tax=Kouleothrix sp. TaxID=2779161 RepID=UPI002C80D128|nr:hypothetical protein [Kouleothrix sp.]HRC74226.1 hypothetical protein [Kouleothrix sp.]
MAVTQKTLRSNIQAQALANGLPRRMYSTVYLATLLLAAVAIYVLVSLLLGKAQVLIDDVRYGRPRTVQLDAFVGHDEASGQPTHLIAVNLNRQAMIIELPGGNPANARTISGPYLFGADEDLTPLALELRDMDNDGNVDLLLDVRNEQVVYLNKDGVFRLPTAAEQARLAKGNAR